MDEEKIKKAVRDILEAVGENPQREGLKDTPQRVANMYKEILGGIDKNPALELKILKGQSFDEIVLVKEASLHCPDSQLEQADVGIGMIIKSKANILRNFIYLKVD